MAKVAAYQQLQWNRIKRELDVAQCKRGLVALEHQLEPYAEKLETKLTASAAHIPRETTLDVAWPSLASSW